MGKLLITAIIVASGILCSCGQSENGVLDGYKEISVDDVSYDLYVPEDWVVDAQRAYTSAHKNETTPANISVMAHELTSKTIFKDDEYDIYWKNSVEPSLKQMFPDLEYVTEAGAYKLDNNSKDAAQYIYTFTVDHGKDSDGTDQKVKYKVQQIILKDETTLYTLTYTASEDQYSEYETEVSDIWYNFRLH